MVNRSRLRNAQAIDMSVFLRRHSMAALAWRHRQPTFRLMAIAGFDRQPTPLVARHQTACGAEELVFPKNKTAPKGRWLHVGSDDVMDIRRRAPMSGTC